MAQESNRVAVVTGASRGIGRGCALALAKGGADIVVNFRSHPEEAEETAAAVRDMGREAITVGADVADRAAVDAMMARAMERFGRIDIVVANAALSIRGPFLELAVEDVKRTWDVSLWGVFHACQSGARRMVARGGGGKIVVVSSVLSFMPFAHSVPYNAAKAAINQMAYTIATELAPHRINVNVVEPGWTDTPGERRFTDDETLYAEGRRLPWGRLATIDDIGAAVAFLASDEADYITGACLRVDGGFWLPRTAAATRSDAEDERG
jgi:glucose 1-dehydrogenase